MVAGIQMGSMLGKGIYSLTEAARLTGIASQTIRTWFVGRTDRQKPILEADYRPYKGDIAISFQDMIDAFFLSHFRVAGVTLQRLRLINDNFQNRFGTKHGFCHERLRTDGATVFLEEADKVGGQKLVDLFNNQMVIPKVILPFLKSLEFDSKTHLANLWKIYDGVVVNPAVNFGKPIIKDSGISTSVLHDAFKGNQGNVEFVAACFNVRPDEVAAAVSFERNMLKRAA